MIKPLLIVGIGGALGSILRYICQRFLPGITGTGFPWNTLWINLAGCFIIGLFWGYFSRNSSVTEDLKLLAITGFCGGFTTFSAFSVETLQLIRADKWVWAVAYISASVTAGVLLTFLGYKITQ